MKKRTMAIALVFLLAGCVTPEQAGKKDSVQEEEIRALLKKHPELVMDVLRENKIEVLEIVNQGIQAKRELERKKRLEAELKNPFKPEIPPDRIFKGKPDAPVTIVEYSNFQCYYCARAAGTMEALLKKYPDTIRLYFKHLPVDGLSKKQALYFEAIADIDPGLAWKFHDLSFQNQREIAKEKEKALDRILASMNMDRDRLEKAIKEKELEKRLVMDRKEGNKFGFRGTPMFLINGVSVKGALPIENFEEVIRLVSEKQKETVKSK